MRNQYQTDRLILVDLDLEESKFIAELVNTPSWIQFIGERNVKTPSDANNYIQKIIDSPAIRYWVVKLKDNKVSIGIVTFIKKDYLDYFDIGFAFLPQYSKKGYAFEAVNTVLNDILMNTEHQKVLAATIKENANSIKLLKKLGFELEKEIANNELLLDVYAISK